MAHSTKIPAIPPAERINTSYKAIVSITPDLHAAARELSGTIDDLNKALGPLALGVTAWHQIASNEDENGNYWSRSIGYTAVQHEWCIALKDASGNENYDHHTETVWAFRDAPRWMAIESIAKLPELFETILERVQETIQKLRARTAQAKELLAAVTAAVDEIAPPKAKK
jgi:hypothetical protein